MDNPKAVVKTKRGWGKVVFAAEDISKGEIIAEVDGEMYPGDAWENMPEPKYKYEINHAIQCGKDIWRGSKGIADQLNHSCDPNCGIKGLFTIVTMRDIEKGEELTWDYEMTEDAEEYNWKMNCKCNSPLCRKIIGAFRNMPSSLRKKYKGYISEWLVKKYSL